MSKPPLQMLHPDHHIIQLKIDLFRKLSTQEIRDSLCPGQTGSLKARPDGTVIDGHHRLIILRERGVDIDDLPRDIIPKDAPTT